MFNFYPASGYVFRECMFIGKCSVSASHSKDFKLKYPKMYSGTPTNGHLSTTATSLWSTNSPYINSCLNLSTMTTSLQWQWPLKCVPNCQDTLSTMAFFFHQLTKISCLVMIFDPMAFQTLFKVFCVFYLYINIKHDWITIVGYCKHELSTINMLYSLKKLSNYPPTSP